MADHLFQGSWYHFWQDRLARAARDVADLNRQTITDPALAGRLQSIADKYAFEVANLDKSRMHAKERVTDDYVRDAWGEHRQAQRSWLDVTIPFTGNADSFRLSPSQCTLMYHECVIGSSSLTLTIPDDGGAQQQVDNFLAQANQNLDALRKDYEQSKPQLEQSIQKAAEERQRQIAADKQRDSKLSFPVKRG